MYDLTQYLDSFFSNPPAMGHLSFVTFVKKVVECGYTYGVVVTNQNSMVEELNAWASAHDCQRFDIDDWQCYLIASKCHRTAILFKLMFSEYMPAY